MAQLHELLAAEQDLRGQANKILTETKQVFSKPELFKGSVKSYQPFLEAVDDPPREDYEKLGTTVEKRLAYTAEALAPYWDAVFQKEKTNQASSADILIDGVAIAKDVPGTVLLGLESKLVELRGVIENMPTLDIKTEWIPAPGQEKDVSVTAHDEVVLKTKKKQSWPIVVPATVQHPAQIKEVTEDINIGKYSKKVLSGAVTSLRCSEILAKTDKLLRAVKAARQRANQQLVVQGTIGATLLDFILK